MKMREENCLRMNVEACELSRQVFSALLAVGDAIHPIEKLHRLGVTAIRRIFRKRVIETRIHKEVSKARMVYPMNQYGEIPWPMIASRLLGAFRIQIQTSVHMDNTGLER